MGGAGDWVKAHAARVGLAVGTGGASELTGVPEAIDKLTPDDPQKPKTAAQWRALGISNPDPSLVLPDATGTPDLTDDLVQRSRLAAIHRAQMGGALQQTFLTGPLGDPTTPVTGKA